MIEVFLSYEREDAAIARQVAECLREEGWSVFWDREIPVGKTWEHVIEEHLSRATCVVVLWSSVSVSSDWVRAEAAAAADRGVLGPALIDRASPPARFRLIQPADLGGWQGRREHVGLTNLIAAVRAALGSTRTPNTAESVGGSDEIRRAPERRIAIAEIETGENRGRSLVLTEGMTSITIGRSRDCDFVIDDFYISRSHCRLVIEPIHSGSFERGQYRFSLIDLGSPAGTIVNEKGVERVDLRDGDRFRIGSVRFRFRILDEGAA
jgi:TIR domain/FHA domain